MERKEITLLGFRVSFEKTPNWDLNFDDAKQIEYKTGNYIPFLKLNCVFTDILYHIDQHKMHFQRQYPHCLTLL